MVANHTALLTARVTLGKRTLSFPLFLSAISLTSHLVVDSKIPAMFLLDAVINPRVRVMFEVDGPITDTGLGLGLWGSCRRVGLGLGALRVFISIYCKILHVLDEIISGRLLNEEGISLGF